MIRLDKVYQNVFRDKFKVLPLLTTIPEEFGRQRAKLKGKKKITKKIIESFVTPDYAWAIRSLLEDEKCETLAELYQDFAYYDSIATVKDAKSYLRTALYYSATAQIDNTVNKPFIFENDKDFKATHLYLNNLSRDLDLFKAYFDKKNDQVKSNDADRRLIKYHEMTLEEFTKKTRCDVYTEKVGYYERHQHSVKTYFIYIDKDNQVVRDKNDGKNPTYKKILRSNDSQITKRMAWEYLKEQFVKEAYDFELLKAELLKIQLDNDDSVSVLWAVKIGEKDAYEELITDKKDKIEAAKRWAIQNGYHKFRIAKYEGNELPNFAGTVH